MFSLVGNIVFLYFMEVALGSHSAPFGCEGLSIYWDTLFEAFYILCEWQEFVHRVKSSG